MFTAVFVILVLMQIDKRFDWTTLYPLSTETFSQTLFSGLSVLVLFLAFANWSLEAIKWQELLKPIEKVSFRTSFKSVLSGFPFAIITPNRLGEFGGRILILSEGNKPKGVIATWLGGWIQGFVTLFAGIPGLIYYEDELSRYFGLNFNTINVFYIIVVCLMPLVFIFLRMNIAHFLVQKLQFIASYSTSVVFKLIGLSALRYVIFCVQWILLCSVGLHELDWGLLLLLIPLSFALSTLLSFVSLLEPVQRATVTMVLGLAIGIDSLALHVAICGFVLWCFNLLLPSLIGLIFVWFQPIFKKNDLD